MSDSLHQLVYYSRNQIPGDAASLRAHVTAILETSRRNNARDGITGALLFNAGCFAQIVEGPLDAVEATFERIQQDERHSDVSVLALEPVERRSFANWAMGFIGRSAENAENFAAIGLESGFDPKHLDGARIHSILKELALEEELAPGCM